MSWLTIVGMVSIILGVLAYMFDCPYGVHIGAAGAVLTLLGFFLPKRHAAP